ncbi:MAG: hypothetical protein ACRDU8_01110, partial [Egibacteraceae bacterium]
MATEFDDEVGLLRLRHAALSILVTLATNPTDPGRRAVPGWVRLRTHLGGTAPGPRRGGAAPSRAGCGCARI